MPKKEKNHFIYAVVELITHPIAAPIFIVFLLILVFIFTPIGDIGKEIFSMALQIFITVFLLDGISQIRERIRKNETTIVFNEMIKIQLTSVRAQYSKVQAIDYSPGDTEYFYEVEKCKIRLSGIMPRVKEIIPLLADEELVRLYWEYLSGGESLIVEMEHYLSQHAARSVGGVLPKSVKSISKQINKIVELHEKLVNKFPDVGVF